MSATFYRVAEIYRAGGSGARLVLMFPGGTMVELCPNCGGPKE